MSKSKVSYLCTSCGTVHSKWTGQCAGCSEWNTLSEEIVESAVPKGMNQSKKGRSIPFGSLKRENEQRYARHVSGIGEFDRVTGGGLVPGSALLIGGDPGIGKSTLLLQVVCTLSQRKIHTLTDEKNTNSKGEPAKERPPIRCAYISGEESMDQIRLRAERLGLSDAPVELASATNVRDIVTSMTNETDQHGCHFDLVVIDSIQTMYVDNVDSAPGTVTQVRTSAQEIIRTAKKHNICVLFVGHITKEGQIAGPRVLEHMVDTVLYFEGDRSHQFRILRGVKNRFGATDEIGVFEMAGAGLMEVTNPSELFLAQRQQNIPGSAVLAGLEGSRPVLVEVQALVAPSTLATPRRSVIGWDASRLAMITAVLETRCGIQFSGCDIFLNIAGGIRISEPAADLAVAAALVSSINQVHVPAEEIFFGEIGLAGEIRQVSQPDIRLKEASKLGFEEAIIPVLKAKKGQSGERSAAIRTNQIKTIHDLVDHFSSKPKAANIA